MNWKKFVLTSVAAATLAATVAAGPAPRTYDPEVVREGGICHLRDNYTRDWIYPDWGWQITGRSDFPNDLRFEYHAEHSPALPWEILQIYDLIELNEPYDWHYVYDYYGHRTIDTDRDTTQRLGWKVSKSRTELYGDLRLCVQSLQNAEAEAEAQAELADQKVEQTTLEQLIQVQREANERMAALLELIATQNARILELQTQLLELQAEN